LENRVHCYQNGTVFIVATCEPIPDKDLKAGVSKRKTKAKILDVNKHTMAMHRANPTNINPVRRSL